MEKEFQAVQAITSHQYRGGVVSEENTKRIHDFVLKVPEEDRELNATRLWPYEGTD